MSLPVFPLVRRMTSLLEDPKPVIFITVIVLAVLASIIPRTQRYVALFTAMAVVLLLGILGVVAERLVVTDRENIETVIYEAADALEDNDLDRLLLCVSESAQQTRSRARWSLEQIQVLKTKVRNLDVVINELTSPPTAEAQFDGVIYYQLKDASTGREWYPARLSVELRREDARWLITNHLEHGVQRL